MMQLEMFLDGHLVDTAPLYGPFLKQADYLKSMMAALEKKYAPVLSKFEVKPGYILSGVPSSINNFVPLCSSSVSQLTNGPVDTTIHQSTLIEATASTETVSENGLTVQAENRIHSHGATAA